MSISRHKKNRLLLVERYRQQDGRCIWCGEQAWLKRRGEGDLRATREHVIPRSQGGTDHRDNIVMAHLGCNQERQSGFHLRPDSAFSITCRPRSPSGSVSYSHTCTEKHPNE